MESRIREGKKRHKNIYDYIKKNMDGFHGDFRISTTDLSEKEPGAILVLIHPLDKDGETADFILHEDGREEYTDTL